ncbi:MAG: GIY-YIG nuclease family protein [Candidatus Staskawiczbacteria bacterium]|nr:GIY-YIG nuclease family protein [Candidatus Staskawiczbacteria bacterium]
MDKFKFLPKSKLNNLPKTAGVYSFYEKNNAIYIGKAANIRIRVKNHFQQPSYRDNLFMGRITKVGYFETGSEIEALIFEANLIKKYQPKFNVMWRDDKNYFYAAIAKNKEGIPYVFITHQPDEKIQNSKSKTEYIGPFTEGVALKKTLRFFRRVFPYYTANKHPKNKCAYCHLDLCPGPYDDEALRQSLRAKNGDPFFEYKKNIKKLILILKGKRNAVLNSLKKEMKNFSKEKEFEKAAKTRDKIFALQQIMSHTKVINSDNSGTAKVIAMSDIAITLAKIVGLEKPISKIECYDISNIQGKHATGSMVVFIGGRPAKNLYRKFHIKIEGKPNDVAMIKEILGRRLNHPEWTYPEIMLIDGGKAQLNAALKILEIENSLKIENCKLKITIMALAKKYNKLFIEGKDKPILLKTLPREIFNLILRLRDEAHRFAITYHKKLRKKYLLK